MRNSTKKIVRRSKALRRDMSLPEVLLWTQLRKRSLGYKFRHQHSSGPYALDFYCAAAAPCVEVDGAAHDMGDHPKRDVRRDAWLAERGIKTLRIPAEEILRDIEPVIVLIREECASRSPSTALRAVPLPRKSGGGFERPI
jgi:very-short-patch-repair endonuclease